MTVSEPLIRGLQTSEGKGGVTALGIVVCALLTPNLSWHHVALAALAVALSGWWAWLRTGIKRDLLWAAPRPHDEQAGSGPAA